MGSKGSKIWTNQNDYDSRTFEDPMWQVYFATVIVNIIKSYLTFVDVTLFIFPTCGFNHSLQEKAMIMYDSNPTKSKVQSFKWSRMDKCDYPKTLNVVGRSSFQIFLNNGNKINVLLNKSSPTIESKKRSLLLENRCFDKYGDLHFLCTTNFQLFTNGKYVKTLSFIPFSQSSTIRTQVQKYTRSKYWIWIEKISATVNSNEIYHLDIQTGSNSTHKDSYYQISAPKHTYITSITSINNVKIFPSNSDLLIIKYRSIVEMGIPWNIEVSVEFQAEKWISEEKKWSEIDIPPLLDNDLESLHFYNNKLYGFSVDIMSTWNLVTYSFDQSTGWEFVKLPYNDATIPNLILFEHILPD